MINNKKICNNKLYEKCKEEEISVTIKRNKWKLFGHILRLPLNTPVKQFISTNIPEDLRMLVQEKCVERLLKHIFHLRQVKKHFYKLERHRRRYHF